MVVVYILGNIVSNFETLLQIRADPREPPLIPHRGIHFIGHIIGMFWNGAKYFQLVKLVSLQHFAYTQ